MLGVLYAGVCYGAALLVALAFALFVLLPPRGAAQASPAVALAIDAGLLVLFGVQHSLMARPRFKRWLASWHAPSLERSSYLLATVVVFAILMIGWQHWPRVLWSVDGAAVLLLHGVQVAGVLLVVVATFQFDHWQFFGLKPAWYRWREREPQSEAFHLPWLYRQVRHPMMSGFLLLFWCAPTMTADHLLLSLGMTAYILIGLYYEERDLRRTLGVAYEDYARRVPALIPRPWGFR